MEPKNNQATSESSLTALFPDEIYPAHTPAMKKIMDELRVIVANPVVEAAYNTAIANLDPFIMELGIQEENPWSGTTVDDFVNYFDKWFTFLPQPQSGLGFIVPLTFFYVNNPQAFYFMNKLQSKTAPAEEYSKEIFNWTVKFIKERGRFMDSPASINPDYLREWMTTFPHEDFIIPPGGFKTFNEFFTRCLHISATHHPRPVSDPDDDSILVASGDTEINFIESNLTLKTSLPVKTREMNVNQLLNNSSFAKYFVGGTAISCVLMPTSYHHYHAPVAGNIVEGMEVPGIYNGIMDGEHWFGEGNIGASDTDFSIFEDFHRAYFIIETAGYGYVAVIPVGLNTISAIHPSVTSHTYVRPGGTPIKVNKGDELGYFSYGGSLNILLFQPGVLDSISVLQGQRLGSMSKVKN
ncbi:phosphatidylserine decarboxylase [Massilia sp. S19_KUP03_FR1]|uniref:phosphatidylserine decarboxylase n=1 Tax=Massilia sp. S19_KUP03_FR1 TaxID=3025503 RepID=UPI002FCDB5FE